jgi:hypothetical protein
VSIKFFQIKVPGLKLPLAQGPGYIQVSDFSAIMALLLLMLLILQSTSLNKPVLISAFVRIGEVFLKLLGKCAYEFISTCKW